MLHPHVASRVADDLALLRIGLAVAQALASPLLPGLRWLALAEALDEFGSFMARQVESCL